jgi:hypothetical protein
MFARLDAQSKADRRAEAERWRRLSHAEKWGEMAAHADRWRGRCSAGVVMAATRNLDV